MAKPNYLSHSMTERVIHAISESSKSPNNRPHGRGRDEKQQLLVLIAQKSEAIVAMQEEINTLVARLSRPDRVNFDRLFNLGNIVSEALFEYGEHKDGCPAKVATTHDLCRCGLLQVLEHAVDYRSSI